MIHKSLLRISKYRPIRVLIFWVFAIFSRILRVDHYFTHDDPITAVLSAHASSPESGAGTNARGTKTIALLILLSGFARPMDGFKVLLFLTRFWPNEPSLQIRATRLYGQFHTPMESSVLWRGILSRFPLNPEAFRVVNRSIIRESGPAEALNNIDLALPELEKLDVNSLILRAQCLDDLYETRLTEMSWTAALSKEPDNPKLLLNYANSLYLRGYLFHAQLIFLKLKKKNYKALSVQNRLDQLRDLTKLKYPKSKNRNDVYVHGFVIEKLLSQLSKNAVRPANQVKKIILINSSLGPGGAERQFVNTILGLLDHFARRRCGTQLEVWCRNLNNKSNGGFFLSKLTDAGIHVEQYDNFDGVETPENSKIMAPYARLLKLLPLQILTPTLKLTDRLAAAKPDVVHIWQDGSIAAASLACLLAKVPKIALGFRSVPPQNKGRNRDYFLPLFNSLANIPSVAIAANSQIGADIYANWLSLDKNNISIIPNGIQLEIRPPSKQVVLLAETILAPDTKAMMGTVMRLDDNKRPKLWLEVASLIAAQKPNARFIVVGSGPLFASSVAEAKRLEIDDRVLFVGDSNHVAYWLGRMKIFTLLSKQEGMPNAVLEAQSLGIPVVVTQAGGMEEAMAPEKTGILIPTKKGFTAARIAKEVLRLIDDEALYSKMASQSVAYSNEQFSNDTMIKRTLKFYGLA